MLPFDTKAEELAYESGYQDGESSGYADWFKMISDEFDLGDDEIEGPMSFVVSLRRHYDLVPKVG